MDTASWVRLFRIAQSYGINHYRFHSWCPPEAAFLAADVTGMYLQPELPNGRYFEENWCRNAGAKLIPLFGGHGGGGGRLLRRSLLQFFVGALKVFDVSVFEFPDARGHFVKDVFVVSHQ